ATIDSPTAGSPGLAASSCGSAWPASAWRAGAPVADPRKISPNPATTPRKGSRILTIPHQTVVLRAGAVYDALIGWARASSTSATVTSTIPSRSATVTRLFGLWKSLAVGSLAQKPDPL